MQPEARIADITAERRAQADYTIQRLRVGAGPAFARFPIEIAYLYGSVARGCPLPTSDVDLAVILTEPVPEPVEALKLEFAIQEAVEEACGLRGVDVSEQRASSFLRTAVSCNNL